ncbi:MAG TPA: DUF3152 domain-containing protein [Frankiaceae bacterium]|nr:DUF3152 domain-containing protein [Frankiaceae bacterium]
MRRAALAAAAAVLLAACSREVTPPIGRVSSRPSSPTPPAGSSPVVRPTPSPTPSPTPRVVVVRYRVEVRARGVSGFARVVDATLRDPRGWQRAGFRLVRDDSARYLVVVAEPAETDRRCLPYDTYGKYSCQNGPVVAINADRWRSATPEWTGDLATYRQMLVNHEVGHLLGMHHPEVQCPRRGRPAPVMAQQSTELNGCLPNPWPLPHEVRRAARHDLPLAPPYSPKP